MGVTIMMVTSIFAQIEDPVKWTFSVDKVDGQEAELVFSAEIDYPWHLYAAILPAGGPIATTPWYDESDAYILVDGIVEVTKPKVKYDEGFQMDVGTLERKAEFRQKVKFSAAGTQTISGEISNASESALISASVPYGKRCETLYPQTGQELYSFTILSPNCRPKFRS